MMARIRNPLEKRLRAGGFTSPDARRILADQLLLAAASCLLGLAALPLTNQVLAFALGVVLATLNLWQIARFAHRSMAQSFSGKIAVVGFCAFLFRFAGTGLALYFLLVRANLPVIAVAAGLSSLVVRLSVLRLARGAGHSC